MPKKYEQKDCAACGKPFVPTASTMIYCEDCREMGYKRAAKGARDMESATRRNMAVYYDVGLEVRESPCRVCGKPIKYTAYKGQDKTPPDFCSQKCSADNRIRNTKCGWCGKKMTDTDDVRDTLGHTWYCSDACKDAKAWDDARKNGTVKICPHCQKEHIKTGTFCSVECYRADQKEKTRTKQNATAPKRKPNPYGCTTEKRMAMKTAQHAERERKSEEDYIAANGLCPVCSIPYQDCERMTSNFAIIPESARYRDGKIMACPKFASKILKHLSKEDLEQIAERVLSPANHK